MTKIKPEVKYDKDKKKVYIKTGMFRLSYPNLFTPKAIGESTDEKFSLVMLNPKKNDNEYFKKAVDMCIKWKWGGKKPKGFKNPLKDGDHEDYADSNPEYKGMLVINVTTNAKRKPQIIDKNKELITDESEIYPGCWCRATVTCAAYEKGGGRGVAFYLSNVQKLKDDTPFSSAADAEDEFDEVEFDDDEDTDSDDSESDDDEFADFE